MSPLPGSPMPTLADILDRLVAKAATEKPGDFAELAAVAGLDPATDFVGASLREIDLRGEDLRGFDFSKADLTGADFRGANVMGVRWFGANLSGVVGLPDQVLKDAQSPPLATSSEFMREVKRRLLA